MVLRFAQYTINLSESNQSFRIISNNYDNYTAVLCHLKLNKDSIQVNKQAKWWLLYYSKLYSNFICFIYSFGVECRSWSLSMDSKSLYVKSEYTGLLFDNLCIFKFEVS